MSAAGSASPDNIDIKALGRGLMSSFRTVILLSAMAGGLTYLAFSAVAPRFVSEAQITLSAKAPTNPFADTKVDGAPDAVTVRMDKEALNTHVRALMAPDLANKIAGDLKLSERAEFNSELGSTDLMTDMLRTIGLAGPRAGESVQDRVLSAFFRQLEVYSVKDSRFIGIRFTSIDPKLAADIANNLAETYRRMVGTQRTSSDASEVLSQLSSKIEQLASDVAAAEAEVEKFKGQANIFIGAQKTPLNEQQLGELTAELSRASAARSEADAKSRHARELAKSGNADALPDVQRSPVMQTILQQRVRLERQISELSASLLPDHPRMRQLDAELANLKNQIKAEAAKIVDGFEKDAKLSAAREEAIKKSIDELKSRVVSGGADEIKLRQLEATAKLKRAELERLQAQYEAARARADSTPSGPVEVQILSKARPASLPDFPKKGSYAALVFVAVLLFSTAIVILKTAYSVARTAAGWTGVERRKSPQPRVEPAPLVAPSAHKAAIKIEPALAEVANASPARHETKSVTPTAPAPGQALPPVRPEISAIAQRLADRPLQPTGFRTLVVGEHPLLDPAPEALGISRSLADTGASVIMIDWSPTGAGMSSAIGVGPAPGMNELLAGEASFEDVVRRVPGTEVHFIPCGSPVSPGHSVLDPDMLNLLLDALDEAYEQIVVVGRYDSARQLFETILGRFDAGVQICEGQVTSPDSEEMFLGFEVADIVLIRHERSPEQTAARPSQRSFRSSHGIPQGVERIRA